MSQPLNALKRLKTHYKKFYKTHNSYRATATNILPRPEKVLPAVESLCPTGGPVSHSVCCTSPVFMGRTVFFAALTNHLYRVVTLTVFIYLLEMLLFLNNLTDETHAVNYRAIWVI